MTLHTTKHKQSTGFTLIELLVVVAIIAVLLALLAPGLDKAMEQAVRLQCVSIQKRHGMANTMYAQDFRQTFVPIKTAGANPDYEAWLENPNYLQLVGVRPTSAWVWPKEFGCPASPDAWRLTQGYRTVSYNWSGVITAWTSPIIIRRTKVLYPSDKVQMVDSNDWHSAGDSSSRADYEVQWNVYGDIYDPSLNNGGVMYRHTEGAVILHFDGNVRYYPKEEAWHVHADAAKETALNKRRWRVYE